VFGAEGRHEVSRAILVLVAPGRRTKPTGHPIDFGPAFRYHKDALSQVGVAYQLAEPLRNYQDPRLTPRKVRRGPSAGGLGDRVRRLVHPRAREYVASWPLPPGSFPPIRETMQLEAVGRLRSAMPRRINR
jgi:hypothetical protein